MLEQIPGSGLPERPDLPNAIHFALADLFQPMDQVFFYFRPATSSSAFVKSFAVDPLVDSPDAVPLGKTDDRLSRHPLSPDGRSLPDDCRPWTLTLHTCGFGLPRNRELCILAEIP